MWREDDCRNHFALTEGAQLLPCPFCGSADLELDNTHTPSYWIECQDCGCRLSGEYGPDLVKGRYGSKKQHEASARSAIAGWNTRTPDVILELAAEVERLATFAEGSVWGEPEAASARSLLSRLGLSETGR